MPILILFLLLIPGSIPIYFVATFIIGLTGGKFVSSEKARKFSGFNLGKKVRNMFTIDMGS